MNSGCQRHAPCNYFGTNKKGASLAQENHGRPKACAMSAGKQKTILRATTFCARASSLDDAFSPFAPPQRQR
jgi:hypothetical protein